MAGAYFEMLLRKMFAKMPEDSNFHEKSYKAPSGNRMQKDGHLQMKWASQKSKFDYLLALICWFPSDEFNC